MKKAYIIKKNFEIFKYYLSTSLFNVNHKMHAVFVTTHQNPNIHYLSTTFKSVTFWWNQSKCWGQSISSSLFLFLHQFLFVPMIIEAPMKKIPSKWNMWHLFVAQPLLDFMSLYVREDKDWMEHTITTAFFLAMVGAQLSRAERTAVASVVVCLFWMALHQFAMEEGRHGTWQWGEVASSIDMKKNSGANYYYKNKS